MFARRIAITVLVAIGIAVAAWANDPNEVDFATRTPQEQSTVKKYKKLPDEVKRPTTIIRNFDGTIDRRSPEERYLHPNHPGVQPRPDSSTYTRYLDVPIDPELPIHVRPVPGEDPMHKFKTLPKIVTRKKIPVTYYVSPEGIYPKNDPFSHPPGTNFLPTINQNARDGLDKVMENTLPSTRTEPYNLHDGPPRMTQINPTSPTEDLRLILDRVYQTFTGDSANSLWENLSTETHADYSKKVSEHVEKIRNNRDFLKYHLQWAIDIIEGNPIQGRAYSGFRLFHHSGQNRIKRIKPIYNDAGQIVSGNVEVHQLWYDQRIESDTMFIEFFDKDPKGALLPRIPDDVPWTITYTIDVLNRGDDDFATTTMFFDNPVAEENFANNGDEMDQLKRFMNAHHHFRAAPGRDSAKAVVQRLPHISMDQTFFPMNSGTRTVLTIKMPPHKYYNLTYTWGWRVHPPRAQAMENTSKKVGNPNDPSKPLIPIVDAERQVFGGDFKYPIDAIGDLAPAKRMWRAFKSALDVVNKSALDVVNKDDSKVTFTDCLEQVLDARNAYLDWKDRTHLPSGLKPDPGSDLTLFYVNNTIYGELTDGGFIDLPKWRERDTPFRVTLINGDYFDHGYFNIDFGGDRGWENQFKSSIQVAGSGSFFTFGRFHWRMNTNPGTITVSKAEGWIGERPIKPGEMPDRVEPGVHRVWIDIHHDPSRRLRFYQFDPAHHDVAIYSIH